MTREDDISAFGQVDPTDRRERWEWETRYPNPAAQRAIRLEATYLAILLFGTPLIMGVLWLKLPKYWFHFPDQSYPAFLKYALAWGAGVFGGTLFDVKWLYHSVARGWWNIDRRLWRIFTPHISGGLAFAVTALISSGMVSIFDGKAMDSHCGVIGFGFLVGYFSDSAIAKLYEIAETIFGTSRSKERHKDAEDFPRPPERSKSS